MENPKLRKWGRPICEISYRADDTVRLSKIDASLRTSDRRHWCGNPVDFPGVSWDACRGRCRAQLFATKERYRCGLPLAGTHQPAFLNQFFSFSLRKKRTVSIFQEKKEGIQNRKCKPCRHRVRRSQLHSVSAGAAKTPYPQPSSSFPNCDRFTGSQFGHLEFYNAARDLDDGGQTEFCGYGL